MHSNSYLPAFCLLCTNMLDRSLIRLEITHADYFTAILLDRMNLKKWEGVSDLASFPRVHSITNQLLQLVGMEWEID